MSKAYPDDEFEQEDWQLLDFMKKLRLPYPLDENMQAKADTFKLWTKELALKPGASSNNNNLKKPWWKFW